MQRLAGKFIVVSMQNTEFIFITYNKYLLLTKYIYIYYLLYYFPCEQPQTYYCLSCIST